MVYRGENMLVLESKSQSACHVLLSRRDLMTLQDTERCIFEAISYKNTIILPTVLRQFKELSDYIDEKYSEDHSPPTDNEEMLVFIKHTDVSIFKPDTHRINLFNQIKLYAGKQLAERWNNWNDSDVAMVY